MSSSVPSEHVEQCALVRWAKLQAPAMPGLEMLYAIPNGGQRHIAVASKLRAEGAVAGVPDLCLPVPTRKYSALYIELKRRVGGRVSKVQQDWIDKLRAYGNRVEVCHGADEARAVILDYLRSEEACKNK